MLDGEEAERAHQQGIIEQELLYSQRQIILSKKSNKI